MSQSVSEREVYLMTAQQIRQMRDEDILIFHRNTPPIQAKRMDWRNFPLLQQRQRMAAPPLPTLPPLTESKLQDDVARRDTDAPSPLSLDDPDEITGLMAKMN